MNSTPRAGGNAAGLYVSVESCIQSSPSSFPRPAGDASHSAQAHISSVLRHFFYILASPKLYPITLSLLATFNHLSTQRWRANCSESPCLGSALNPCWLHQAYTLMSALQTLEVIIVITIHERWILVRPLFSCLPQISIRHQGRPSGSASAPLHVHGVQ